ncbi:hypothetical protein SAMN04488007_3473 [Maribacter aquivivus]|uniref:Uncharacterized protein n=1 Tax=Maribacter aquivivus TaxID=228958 RepID=A0A1M6U3U2_9FLAO|nr:hypothetical protein [Maribacter aquivivus]SHK63833.1 hypothetical protein SAMN04488007_3473 [Maribacter aquivivus]
MKIHIKSFFGDDSKAGCLICNTTHHKGKALWIKEGCSCGNIQFFDITPDYVRISVEWPMLTVESSNDWRKEILQQIHEHGKPLMFKNIPNKDIVDDILK